jgi:hypothetical protein
VAACGDYVFIADHAYGLQVIDVSDPTNPTLAAVYDTPSHAHGIDVSGDYAYVADWASGLQVIEVFQRRYCRQDSIGQSLVVSEPENPILRVELNTVQTDSIGWQISADSGGHWQEMLPGSGWRVLNYPGKDLCWRSTHVYAGGGINPACTYLEIGYDTDVAGVTSEILPGLAHLSGCSPNPFNRTAAVRFHLPEACRVLLTVHDVQGRRIAVLEDGRCGAGDHTRVWDARDPSGNPAAPGIYLIRLHAGNRVSTLKTTLLR